MRVGSGGPGCARCPTLILHSKDDVRVPFAGGRLLAASIPGSVLVPIHGLTRDEPGWQQALDAIDDFLEPCPRAADFSRLTPRQLEILEPLAQGSPNADIADSLHLSQKAVRNQVSAIFEQLTLSTRGAAVVRAREAGFGQGVIPPPGRT
jgi:DNA-binding NarL/FixJ family response regulator